MPSTATDQSVHVWKLRRYEQDRLVLLRRELRGICGCERCNDLPRGAELDAAIARSVAAITHYADQLCERSRT
jgi:hypothetical protein